MNAFNLEFRLGLKLERLLLVGVHEEAQLPNPHHAGTIPHGGLVHDAGIGFDISVYRDAHERRFGGGVRGGRRLGNIEPQASGNIGDKSLSNHFGP